MTFERIEIDPAVMFGKPVIKGTRITVEHILRKLAGGMTMSEIAADHPHLVPDDIYAAAAFAADHIARRDRLCRWPAAMRLLADECCDTFLVSALRADGHDVLYALETFPGTSRDRLLS
jgi:uncharacterized protein (DUF433 family)